MRARDNTPLRSMMIECGRLPEFSCRQREEALPLMASLERPSGRVTVTAGSSGITPSTIMSPATKSGRPSTEIRLGVFFLRAREPVTSHPRVLCERGPPKERIDLEVQTMYPAFDVWVLYR